MTYTFKNGYGASVISHGYGSESGLLELAVIDARSGRIVYDTPITDDVVGWLKPEDVRELLDRIEALPPRGAEA